jgi:Na+-transporting NADH:ubiquinone oxidoreductase subunit C
MNKNSNSYVLIFSVIVCVVISTALALTATALKSTQEAAAEFDRQKNVMMAAGLIEAGDQRPRAELEKLYTDRVRPQVIDTKTGEVVEGKLPKDVDDLNKAAEKADKADAKRYRAVATTRDEADKLSAIVLPISGRGLWSTLYGYLALEADGDHVRGITFYKHGETPGLGGEVENPDWTAMWKGKRIRGDGGKLTSVTVKKGKVDASKPDEKAHYVDGLSGATITSNGVTSFVKSDLAAFLPFLNRITKS